MKKLLLAGAMLLASMTTAFAEPVKVGFIYVGPIGDHGWTYRHDIGRQQVEEAFGDQVETMYLESVQVYLFLNNYNLLYHYYLQLFHFH